MTQSHPMQYALLIVTADACDSVDSVHTTVDECMSELDTITRELGPNYRYSPPIDGHGIVYAIDNSELHVHYRYQVSAEDD